MAIDALLAPPPVLQPEPTTRARVPQALADVAVVLALGWWATRLTWATGGREPHVLTIGLVLVGLAGALVRPWRTLPSAALLAGLGVGVGAFLVTATAPTGWRGASEAASWAYVALHTLVTAAWARDARRREVVLFALAVAPLLSFAQGWTAWWSAGDPTRRFLGTFYWHNQAGIFLARGVLAGAVLVVVARRVVQWAGWVVVAVCGAGVVVSTSRASHWALVAGLALLLVLALVRRAWWVALKTVLCGLVVTASSYALTGPPFFAERTSPLAGTAARVGSTQSLAVNGGHRLDDWRYAWKTFAHWPLTGTGFHGFASGSAKVDKPGSMTPFAHNGLLQLLVDGGLLLAVPVLLSLALVAVAAGRELRAALRSRDWVVVGAGVALVALLLHSGVDFDWSYPALLSAFGLAAALVVRPAADARPGLVRSAWPYAAAVVLAIAAVGAWHGGLTLNVALGGSA